MKMKKKGIKPKFVIRIDHKGPFSIIQTDGTVTHLSNGSGYYSGRRAWQQIPKDEADRLTHKEAYRTAGHLKRLGYAVNVEEINDEEE